MTTWLFAHAVLLVVALAFCVPLEPKKRPPFASMYSSDALGPWKGAKVGYRYARIGSVSAEEARLTICRGSLTRKATKLRVVSAQGFPAVQTSALKSMSCAVPRNSVGAPSRMMVMGDRRPPYRMD